MIGIIINSVLISSILSIGFFGWLRNLFTKKNHNQWYEQLADQEIQTDWVDGFIDEPALTKKQILSVKRNGGGKKSNYEPMIKSPELSSVATSSKVPANPEATEESSEYVIPTVANESSQSDGSIYPHKANRQDELDEEQKKVLELQRLGFVSINREAPKQNKKTPTKKKF
ncbi:MAG: hypothetical protein VXX39_04805 [Candidatus Thermoplasmatota archaeon]|nr:hypothetical protein [Candidatus Thermoplasmatota archaeon]